jgi:hypothetical protein
MMIVLLLLSIGKTLEWIIANFDVTAAFLEGLNDYIQYCRLPKELGNLRVRCVKSIYGEKQAPKIWSDKMCEVLLELGFLRCPTEACLYKYETGTVGTSDYECMYLSMFVDDGLMVASSLKVIQDFMIKLQKLIKKATLFHPIKKYLGIDCTEEDCYINLSQSTYIDTLDLERLEEKPGKPIRTPMTNSINLREQVPNPNNESLLPVTGKLRYIADRTRPDLLLALGEVSTGGSPHPSDLHIKVSKQIVSYLMNTKSECLRLGGRGGICPFGATDATWITGGNSKSRLGGAVWLNQDSGAIHSYSVNDTTVSHSSCESEIKALDLMVRSIMVIRVLLQWLGLMADDAEPSIIYCDNSSAIELCKTLKSSHKTRHINMRINFIREQINLRVVQLVFVPTELNVVDMLTKALAPPIFIPHADKLLHGFGGRDPLDTTHAVSMNDVLNHITLNQFMQSELSQNTRI